MTEAAAGRAQAPGHEGESWWSIAGRQFRKRRLAVAALWLIFFLFLVAIFAPLLANELPLYARAALPSRYESAFWAYDDSHGILRAALAAEKGDDEKTERVARNLLGRLDDAADLVAPGPERTIREAAREYRDRIAAARAGGGFDPAAWDALREGLEPLSPDNDLAGIVVPRSFFPILRTLERSDWYFIFLFFTVLLFPLANRAIDAVAHARALDPFNVAFLKAGLLLAVPAALAAATAVVWPRKEEPNRKLYKQLQEAAARKKPGAGVVLVFPPVPYGENENILEDQKVKPTWLMSEEERAARVVPDLVKRRDAERERLLRERRPELLGERARLATEIDKLERERMRRSIFARAVERLFPGAAERRLRAGKAEVEAKIAAATAELMTADLDEEIAREHEARRSELRWHWLGTDTNGRDVLARMIYGARVSMSVGFVAEGIAVAIGVILGALAGYFRGWVDIALSRIIEVVICFPVFFFILTILAFLPQSIFNIMVVIGITGWPGIARLMRAEFLRLGNLDFVTAGRALGLSDARLIFRHILPNGMAPILVSTTFGIAGAILVESALSFLGFGVPQPVASWGDTLNNGSIDPQGTWWLTIFPGTALFLTVTAYNLAGDAFRDATDPRLRQ